MPNNPCPCGSGQAFAHCCGRYLSGAQTPPTAEALMRSRYTAYHEGNAAYLLDTWQPRPPALNLDPAMRWIGLRIIAVAQGQAHNDCGTVHFQARYKVNGKAGRLEENSRFRKIGGRWFYLDGEIAENSKPAAP